jgi:zinc protease
MQRGFPLKTVGFVFLLLSAAMTLHAQRQEVQQKPASTPPATTQAITGQGAEHHRLVNQADEIVTILKNGMTVITKRVPSPVLTVRGYVYTGGVYEGPWLGGGLSHLLEHLVAGGSNARRSEEENRTLLQKIGNNSNAYTTTDHTAYFVNTTPEHADAAVDLVTGWMLTASITTEEYKREYEVVQRELEKGKGEPDRQFYYLGMMNRYRVSPARVPVIGYQEVIQSLSRDDVYAYYKLTYQPNNMVFSLAGDLPPAQMLAAVQKHVNDAAPGRQFLRDIPQEPPIVAPRTVVATFPKLGQAKLQLAFPTIDLFHPDLFALDLLSAVLSDGESSLLIQELRDRQQLVSAIGTASATPAYADGSFEIEMELDPDKIGAATAAVLEQLAAVAKDGVDADRLDRAKVQVRSSRIKSQQTAEAIGSSLATDYMTTGDPHFTDRYVKSIQQVTAAQVQEMARKYFDRSKLLTTVMLPAEYAGAEGLARAEDLIRAVAPTTAAADPAPEESVVTRETLANGTVLLHKRIATTPLVVMQTYAVGGVTAENDKNNGIGNLTMELLPRGTKSRSAEDIASFFDSIGGDLSTICGNNTWAWTATCMKEDAAKAMEVYADVINNPSFPESEIGQMKKRIIAGIESIDADWTSQAMRFFKQKYFSPIDSPYQFLPIGQKENVERFTAEDTRKWYDEQIRPASRVLAIYGDIELKAARQLAEKHLGGGPKLAAQPKKPAPSPGATETVEQPSVEVRSVEINKTQQPLAGVVIGFDAHPVIGEEANFPIIVGDTMCSGYGYPTGYLHEILRGRGLVYVVHAQNIPGRSQELPGTFLVYAGCDPAQVNEVVEIILENVARLQGSDADMQEGWFERSKQLAVTADALQNETPAEQATTAALDELYGLGYDYHEQFDERVNAVKIDDVRRVARSRLMKAVVTISTPAPEAAKIEKGTRTYKTFPPVDLTPRGVQHDAAGS